ncbi:hypothetical protein [Mycoplasma suis]|uniref:Uncharacterized protein n=2 Tax=Mycoplasma suis TaxID=57372 RepID=F0QRE5_MYCSL|nr:hypothetical protein [Mycoplasma suis]ADX98065.1 hypothetical protein MSU_0531 [Mycoplasma suis str. Illinois]CBZ40563.1 hypothetical protein MSUIS_04700 [Mycoplasma suis KI3806]
MSTSLLLKGFSIFALASAPFGGIYVFKKISQYQSELEGLPTLVELFLEKPKSQLLKNQLVDRSSDSEESSSGVGKEKEGKEPILRGKFQLRGFNKPFIKEFCIPKNSILWNGREDKKSEKDCEWKSFSQRLIGKNEHNSGDIVESLLSKMASFLLAEQAHNLLMFYDGNTSIHKVFGENSKPNNSGSEEVGVKKELKDFLSSLKDKSLLKNDSSSDQAQDNNGLEKFVQEEMNCSLGESEDKNKLLNKLFFPPEIKQDSKKVDKKKSCLPPPIKAKIKLKLKNNPSGESSEFKLTEELISGGEFSGKLNYIVLTQGERGSSEERKYEKSFPLLSLKTENIYSLGNNGNSSNNQTYPLNLKNISESIESRNLKLSSFPSRAIAIGDGGVARISSSQ